MSFPPEIYAFGQGFVFCLIGAGLLTFASYGFKAGSRSCDFLLKAAGFAMGVSLVALVCILICVIAEVV